MILCLPERLPRVRGSLRLPTKRISSNFNLVDVLLQDYSSDGNFDAVEEEPKEVEGGDATGDVVLEVVEEGEGEDREDPEVSYESSPHAVNTRSVASTAGSKVCVRA